MAILTISREYGSGGKAIGEAVAASLGYEYLDKERIFQDIGAAGHKWEEWGNELDERCPTVWERYDWSFRGVGALIEHVLLSHAARDRVVIVGRGGSYLLKGVPHSLRIRVVADVEERVSRISQRESVDRETARWLMEKTDRERACFLYALYGTHGNDPEDYDTVYDTTNRTVEETALLVKDRLIERDSHSTEESRKVVAMRALAAKIKAGLLTNPSFFVPVLDVCYDEKDIVLRGVVHNPKERKRVEDAARALAGDMDFRSELHYRG